jgi:ferredoxin
VVTAIFVLISCADNLEKLTSLDNLIRIEFSDCSSCYECLDLFSCPYGAIKIDSTHIAQRAYIDTDLCVQCMDCINLFQCPEFAFKRNPDTIPPAPITELSGVSFHVGRLDIQFISTGDDSTKGITYKYDFFLTDSAGDTLEIDYEAPNPGITGYWEYWPPIFNLPSEDLSIHITALDEVGNRSAEAVATASIYENIAPAAIVDLEMENVLADGFTLTWSAVGDDGYTGTADHYIIKIHTEPITNSNWLGIEEYPNSLVPSPAGDIQFFIINDLSENTLYFAAVKTIDEWNNISYLSNVVQGTTLAIPDLIAPAPINDLIVLTNSINDNSFSLQWTATGDDDLLGNTVYYIIKIHESNIDDYNWDFLVEYPQNMIPAASGQIENLIIADLAPATEYFAGIKAVDDAQNVSSLSNIASALTCEIPDTDPPSSITDLVAEGTETTIKLCWTTPGDDGDEGICNHYEIRIHTVDITPNNWNYAQILPEPPTPLIAGSMQSYSVDDLEQMQNYFFAIKAFDESGNESEISNSPMATLIQDITPPSTISDLLVVAGYTPNLSTIKIQ